MATKLSRQVFEPGGGASPLTVRRVPQIQPASSRSAAIAVGAAAGGVDALVRLSAGLPATLNAAVFIVLHVGAHRSDLPALLAAAGPLPAKHAETGETIVVGQIYVAPPDRHMTIRDGLVHLSRGPTENWARPAINPLFRSAAAEYGPHLIGVVLTGRLNDGSTGLMEIKRRGGVTIVQAPGDAAYPAMPSSALVSMWSPTCAYRSMRSARSSRDWSPWSAPNPSPCPRPRKEVMP